MATFKIHSVETAPEDSRPTLEQVKKKFGFIPNLLGIFAEAPAALKGYLSLAGLMEQSSLNENERQVIFMAASYENECGYCLAAHSTMAKAQKVPEDIIAGLRKGGPLGDPKLEALRRFVRAMVKNSGWVDEEEVNAFLKAGYSQRQILEVITGIAAKTITNYTNHLARTPVDKAFEPQKWQQTDMKK